MFSISAFKSALPAIYSSITSFCSLALAISSISTLACLASFKNSVSIHSLITACGLSVTLLNLVTPFKEFTLNSTRLSLFSRIRFLPIAASNISFSANCLIISGVEISTKAKELFSFILLDKIFICPQLSPYSAFKLSSTKVNKPSISGACTSPSPI